ncbi:MAG: sulfur carrier protein ThiS [Alphaproteobacteria bacterium]|nr:sulfur carrier protein ThiS [Alphaproteobacteria bacterium]
MEITLNGDRREIAADQTVTDLLQDLKLDPARVAVERNLEIIPKTTYQNVKLLSGDRLEIVYFIGGGS